MKHTAMKAIGALTLALTLSSSANAALVERLGGQAYYDDVLDITWLANANLAETNLFGVEGVRSDAAGSLPWGTANLWIDAMNADGGTGYLGFNDWRLPTMIDTGSIGCDRSNAGGTDCGYNVQTGSAATTVYSELASLFYDTLGNSGRFDTNGDERGGTTGAGNGGAGGDWGLVNTGPFINLENPFYWTGLLYGPDNTQSWYLQTYDGKQTHDGNLNGSYILPVRNGDVGTVSAVPEPPMLLLLGAAFIGLAGRKYKR